MTTAAIVGAILALPFLFAWLASRRRKPFVRGITKIPRFEREAANWFRCTFNLYRVRLGAEPSKFLILYRQKCIPEDSFFDTLVAAWITEEELRDDRASSGGIIRSAKTCFSKEWAQYLASVQNEMHRLEESLRSSPRVSTGRGSFAVVEEPYPLGIVGSVLQVVFILASLIFFLALIDQIRSALTTTPVAVP